LPTNEATTFAAKLRAPKLSDSAVDIVKPPRELLGISLYDGQHK
jgi:hypothetical protein